MSIKESSTRNVVMICLLILWIHFEMEGDEYKGKISESSTGGYCIDLLSNFGDQHLISTYSTSSVRKTSDGDEDSQ